MENEIKLGEYCRTKNGLIAKLIEPQVYEINDKECIEFLEDIVKHSPNLIDLIQCGDYVNGKEVIMDLQKSKDMIILEGNIKHVIKLVTITI